MFISDFAIKKPIVTVTAMVALVAFGIAALYNIQTDEFPDVQQPMIAVTIPYPGASPETVEREIVEPVEEAFSGISGVDWSRTTSNSIDGLAQFLVAFEYEKNLQEASQDIRDAISTMRSDLPVEMKEPILSRIDPGQQPIMTLTLTSTTLDARRADPHRRSRPRPGVAGGAGRRAGPRRGCGHPGTHRAAPAGRPAGGGRGGRRSGPGAGKPEPRGAGRQREGAARGEVDPAQGPARASGGLCRRSWWRPGATG